MSSSEKKLPADGTVDSGMITDGTIVNADINASAAIVQSKLSLDDATDTAKGIATFDENDFLVTSGDVTRAVRTRYQVSVPGGSVENLGVTLSGGTFTITGADGTALSATNPAWIVMQDKSSPGLLKQFEVTADQSFIDDAGSSEIIGNLFGVTTGVAWGNDCPFYIYAVSSDDEASIAFMISRIPHRTTAPAVGEIGAPDDAVADEEYSFFSFDNIDETLYDGNPCICIGSIRMQMSASDDWTVQTLAVTDGIGQFNENTEFYYPKGHHGAAASTYTIANGGTSAAFVTNNVRYYLAMNGDISVNWETISDAGTDGSGAVEARFAVPMQPDATAINNAGHNFMIAFRFAGGIYLNGRGEIPSGQNYFRIRESSASAFKTWADFSNGNRNIQGFFTYKVNQA